LRRAACGAATPVTGRVAVLPDSLVFIGDEAPASSFVVVRSNVQALTADADTATVQLNKEVNDRAGSTTRVILRFSAAPQASAAQRWFGSPAATAEGAASFTSSSTLTFGAQHNKRRSGDTVAC
jgi:hypothetical protein